MIGNLFKIPFVSVQVQDWQAKKSAICGLLRDYEFERTDQADFDSDRRNNGGRYGAEFCEIFSDELSKLAAGVGLKTVAVRDVWAVRYGRNDYHAVHNHRSTGYSGILYVDFDEHEHSPTVYVSPWNDPVSDTSQLSSPPVREGMMVMVPSSVLHYTRPSRSDRMRSVIAFDLDAR